MKEVVLAGLIIGGIGAALGAEEPSTAKKFSRAELEQQYAELAAEQAKHLDYDQLEGIVASIERFNREMAAHERLSKAVENLRESLLDLTRQHSGTLAAQEAENILKTVSVERTPTYATPPSKRTKAEQVGHLIAQLSGIEDAKVSLGPAGTARVMVVSQKTTFSVDHEKSIRKIVSNCFADVEEGAIAITVKSP